MLQAATSLIILLMMIGRQVNRTIVVVHYNNAIGRAAVILPTRHPRLDRHLRVQVVRLARLPRQMKLANTVQRNQIRNGPRTLLRLGRRHLAAPRRGDRQLLALVHQIVLQHGQHVVVYRIAELVRRSRRGAAVISKDIYV
uniref:(northern house mosquito) hypothetical protein n=1 Tax=Culex pipiens TaxID=7175 RepID=A0A8D8DPE1_CULPI